MKNVAWLFVTFVVANAIILVHNVKDHVITSVIVLKKRKKKRKKKKRKKRLAAIDEMTMNFYKMGK